MHWIDPDHLPETIGAIDQFLLNAKGEVDGLLLADGTEVHVPPYLSSALLEAVHLGSKVKIRGVRPRVVNMIVAVALDTLKGRILDEGPQGQQDIKYPRTLKRGPVSLNGIVKRLIHGSRGEVSGILLKDGRILRIPAREAGRLAALLQLGMQIAAKGDAIQTTLGTVIVITEIGLMSQTMRHVIAISEKPVNDPTLG